MARANPHGMLEAIDDAPWLHAHLQDVTRRANEAGREHPWEVEDAPPSTARAKHRSEGDRLGAIAGLEREPGGAAVAAVMRDLEAARATP